MKKRRKSEEQHMPPGDSFDVWLCLVGTLVFEPVIGIVRSVGRLACGTRQRPQRQARKPDRRRDKR